MPSNKVIYVVYSQAPIQQYTGLLGSIDLRCVWVLLSGGHTLIEEQYDGHDPVAWYTTVLEQQEMVVRSAVKQSYKGSTLVWIDVDYEQTQIQSYTTWRDISPSDTETLAWRPFWIPCQSGTSQECLGFAVRNREYSLQDKHQSQPIRLQTLLDAIIQSSKC